MPRSDNSKKPLLYHFAEVWFRWWRLTGVRLVGLGEREHALWRLPDAYEAAQQEILDKLPPMPAPKLSLKKPVKRRLANPRRGRVPPMK